MAFGKQMRAIIGGNLTRKSHKMIFASPTVPSTPCNMALQLPANELLAHLLQLCKNHLFQNRVHFTFNSTEIDYVPNNIIDEVVTLENTKKIASSETTLRPKCWDMETADDCAQKIFDSGKKLLAITIKAGISPPTEFVLEMMVDHQVSDTNLPWPPGMREPVSAKFAYEFNHEFRPAQLKLCAPSFTFGAIGQYAPSISNIPFDGADPAFGNTDGTVFDVVFNPHHIIGGPGYRAYTLRVFANKQEADERHELVPLFTFYCEEEYYFVSAYETPDLSRVMEEDWE